MRVPKDSKLWRVFSYTYIPYTYSIHTYPSTHTKMKESIVNNYLLCGLSTFKLNIFNLLCILFLYVCLLGIVLLSYTFFYSVKRLWRLFS